METTEFWNSYEQFKREMKAGDTNAARHTLYRMTQLYPHITDNDLMGNKAIIHCALALDRIIVNFNLAYFVPYAMRLADSDWEGERRAGRIVPSLGQRITNRLMSNLRERPDNYIKAIMPFFRKALQINPSNKDNLRHLAQLYARVALKSQAVNSTNDCSNAITTATSTRSSPTSSPPHRRRLRSSHRPSSTSRKRPTVSVIVTVWHNCCRCRSHSVPPTRYANVSLHAPKPGSPSPATWTT